MSHLGTPGAHSVDQEAPSQFEISFMQTIYHKRKEQYYPLQFKNLKQNKNKPQNHAIFSQNFAKV